MGLSSFMSNGLFLMFSVTMTRFETVGLTFPPRWENSLSQKRFSQYSRSFEKVMPSGGVNAAFPRQTLLPVTLKEEGCIAYDTFESSTRPDVFMICETWQNAEVLAAHEKSPHFAQYVGIIQKLAEMKLEKFEF